MRPINPYAAAAGLAALKIATALPPRVTPTKPVMSTAVGEFFDALCINHGGNRAKVSTALAHRLSDNEVRDAITRLIDGRNRRVAELAALNAPEVILRNEKKADQAHLNLLNRVLKSRGLPTADVAPAL